MNSEQTRYLRERLSLTQEQFARVMDVSTPTVNRWEQDKSSPSEQQSDQLENLLCLATNDDVDLEKLAELANTFGAAGAIAIALLAGIDIPTPSGASMSSYLRGHNGAIARSALSRFARKNQRILGTLGGVLGVAATTLFPFGLMLRIGSMAAGTVALTGAMAEILQKMKVEKERAEKAAAEALDGLLRKEEKMENLHRECPAQGPPSTESKKPKRTGEHRVAPDEDERTF